MNEFMQMLFGQGMQGLPNAPSPVAAPLPPPRPKDQGRMGLDQTGLAEAMGKAARPLWPMNAGEVSEVPTLQAPPGFVYGPGPAPQMWGGGGLPQQWMNQPGTMQPAADQPVSDPEYQRLIQLLFQGQWR
jgi:hypothetical protein